MTHSIPTLPHQQPGNANRTAHSPSDGISVIIPLQDEARSVEALLQSINRQSLSPAEVVIVDAGSRDETIRLAHAVPTQTHVRIVRADRVHPGVARNIGVAASRSQWLAFTDGGIILEPDWLAELAAAVAGGTAVVYGHYEPVCDTFFKQCAALAYVPARNPEGTRGPSVASCLVRRSTFDAVGGFPPYRAAEDLIFIERLRAQGFDRVFAPRAVVHWHMAADPRATYARFAAYSYHNLIAGWGRNWHLGVAKLYGLLGLAVGAAMILGLGAGATLMLPSFFLGRALKAGWIKRRSFSFRALSLSRVVGTAAVLVIIDAATLSGWFRWLSSKLAGDLATSGSTGSNRS